MITIFTQHAKACTEMLKISTSKEPKRFNELTDLSDRICYWGVTLTNELKLFTHSNLLTKMIQWSPESEGQILVMIEMTQQIKHWPAEQELRILAMMKKIHWFKCWPVKQDEWIFTMTKMIHWFKRWPAKQDKWILARIKNDSLIQMPTYFINSTDSNAKQEELIMALIKMTQWFQILTCWTRRSNLSHNWNDSLIQTLM